MFHTFVPYNVCQIRHATPLSSLSIDDAQGRGNLFNNIKVCLNIILTQSGKLPYMHAEGWHRNIDFVTMRTLLGFLVGDTPMGLSVPG